MPQQIENTTQSTAGKAIGDILSALKSSMGIGDTENKMFANLLAETGKSMPKIEARDAVDSTQKKEVPKAHEQKEVKAEKDEKPEVRNDDQRREEKKAEDVKAQETSDVKVSDTKTKDVTDQALKELEEQMALALRAAQDDQSGNEIAITDHEIGKTAEDISYDDIVNFLSTLMADKKTGEADKNVEEILAKLKDAKPEEGKNPLEGLAGALQAMEQQLKELSQLNKLSAKAEQTEETASDVDLEGLNQALVKIADNLALLKESRDVAAKELDTKLQGLAVADQEGGEEGLWQKMVQDLRDESLGRKQGASNFQATQQFIEVDPTQAKSNVHANFGQAVAAVAQANKGSADFVPKVPAAPSQTPTITGTGVEGARPTGSYDFASQLSAARETKGGVAGLPKVIEQVSVQLNKAVKNGQTEMTLNLKPADLGKVEVKLTFGEGKAVTGVVVAENQATLNLLQKDADGLVRALQDAGLDADKGSMEFSLKDDGQASAHAHQQKEGGHKGQQKFNVITGGKASDSMMVEAESDAYYVESGRVNLQV